MMAEQHKCQQCGTELPANAPGGVCPKCVMKLGLPTGADPEQSPASDDQNAVPTSATRRFIGQRHLRRAADWRSPRQPHRRMSRSCRPAR